MDFMDKMDIMDIMDNMDFSSMIPIRPSVHERNNRL